MSTKHKSDDTEEINEVTDELLAQNFVNGSNNNNTNGISLGDALKRTGYGKFNYFIILISGMVLANVLLELSAIGFILPIMQCDLQLTNENKGVLSSIGYLGIILSSHLWGFLADTKGRRVVIWPTLLIGFALTFLSSFSNSFWLMTLLRFLNGFFVSGGSATIYAYLGEFHTDRKRSKAIMRSSFIFAMGAMMLPFIAFGVINRDWIWHISFLGMQYKPWRLFMFVCSAPGFLCGIALYFLPESPKYLLSIGKEAECIQVLRIIHKWNGVKENFTIKSLKPDDDDENKTGISSIPHNDNTNVIIKFIQTMWNQTTPLFETKYLRITLITCFIQFWLTTVTNGLYMWFPYMIDSVGEYMTDNPGKHKRICEIVYEKHETLYDDNGTIHCITKLQDTTFLYSFIMEICYASSFIFLGTIINRISKKTILFMILIIFSSCGLASMLITNPEIAAYFYVLLFLVGVAINVLSATTIDLYPTYMRGMAICISLMFGRLGSVIGANVAGALITSHCELTYYVSCGALFLCAGLVFLIPGVRTSNPNDKTIELNEL